MFATARCRRAPRATTGFSLIELLIVMAIIAILAAVAVPSYQDSVLRGRLVDATNALSAMRARMEQYYQDNRTYVGGPCATAESAGTFTIDCSAVAATSYTARAVGSSSTNGFAYTLDQRGIAKTTGLPSSWGTVPTGGFACWILKRSQSC